MMSRADVLRLGSAGLASLLVPSSASAATATRIARPAAHPTDDFQRLKQSMRGGLTLDYRVDDGSELMRIGQWARARGLLGDTYGRGAFIEKFERRMARMLGFEAACFMPTGVMALLSALRIFADRAPTRAVGMHPSSHHLLHEEDAYRIVHQLESAIISPWERQILSEDVEEAPALSSVSVEMPVRWIGGQLQSWEQLAALKAAAKSRGMKLVMDGARLWECQPYYDRSYAEICSGFDAVFVSFYKMIGGLNGALLAADRDVIDEALIWRRRLGGDVYQFFPYVLSAAMRIDDVLPRIGGYTRQAAKLFRQLTAHPEIAGLPSVPPTNLFRLILPGDRPSLMAKRDQIARETGIWVGDSFRPTRVPGLAQVELQIGPFLQALEPDEAAAAFFKLVD